ncbi:MAG: sugar phosphate isomerase/epimerase [Planctomycetes bacterium]|nr:sugar phosphate isomerase/epimerase [Planctomycetota bacterium]
MKFGVVTMALGHEGYSFEAGLAKFREIGFETVLLIGRCGAQQVAADGTSPVIMPDILASDPEHVQRALRNAGLELGSVYFAGKAGWMDIESDEGAKATGAALKEFGEGAVRLGCKVLSHSVPTCGRSKVPTEEKVGPIKRLAACMSETAEAFAEHGLKVCVDVHHKAWVEGLDDCRLLLNSMSSPNAGLLMNIGHLTTTEAYGWLLIDEHPDRIPCVGWKDHSLAPDRPKPMWSIELGTGHSPFELYVRRFKAHPAERVHVVNCENVPDEERPVVLKRSLTYLKQLWEGE